MDAAAEAFSAYGYDKTTVEDIAGMANKAKTTVYYYFNGKADIFSAVLEREIESICLQLAPYRKKLDIILSSNVPIDDQTLQKAVEVVNDEFRAYMMKRMEVILASPVYKKFSIESIRNYVSEPTRILLNARERLTEWEKQYLEELCTFAQTTGTMPEGIQPGIFADILGMIFKGVELHVFTAQDVNAALATYSEMVNYITANKQLNIR